MNSDSGIVSEFEDTIIGQSPAFKFVLNQVPIILRKRKALVTPRPISFVAAHLIHVVFVLTSLFVISHRAFAQTASASISGTVADPSAARIRDARIALRSVDTGVEQTTVTDAAGTFALTSVPPGDYTIRAIKEGFDTTEKTSVELFVAQAVTIDLVLRIGSPQSTLTVVANLSSLDSTTSELGTVIPTTPVNDLPLDGRNFTQLLTLAPGVSPISVAQNSGGGSGWGGNALGAFTFPAVNGQRNRSNMFLVDGITDLAFLGNYNYAPIIDDIQEFKLQSHSDLAEVGAVAGGIVNVVTKQGTNTFHGSAWEFLRNEQLDARNYFLPSRNPLRQNQFGVAAGGPVLIPRLYGGRNKIFFFFAYEGFRQSQATQNVVLVPTAAELGGNFGSLLSQGVQLYNPYSTAPDPANPGEYTRPPFAGNIIPSSLLSPAAELYSKLFPTAGAAIPGGNLYDTTKALQRQDSFTGRMDRAFGSHDRLYGRISYFTEPSSSSAGYPGALKQIGIYGWNGGVHESHTFGPTAVLDLYFGRNYGDDKVQLAFPRAPANFPAALVKAGFSPEFVEGFASSPQSVIPAIGIAGYASTNAFNGQDTQLADNYEFGGAFSKQLGRHTLKAGYDFNSVNYFGPLYSAEENFGAFQTSNLENPTGPLGGGTGNGLASFLLGVPASSDWLDIIAAAHGGSVQGAYVQDEFRVTRRLTLNLGLRYDVSNWPAYGNLSNGQGYVGDLDLSNGTYILSALPPACSASTGAPCIPGGVLPSNVVVTKNKNRNLHNTDYGNWQGRFGIAYRASQTTSIRAGYGRFYDEWNGVTQTAQNVAGTWPSVLGLFGNSQNVNQPTAFIGDPLNQSGGGALVYPPATPFASPGYYHNPNLKTPYVDNWNFGIDRQLGLRTTLSVAYVGSRGSKLDLGGLKNTATVPGPGDAATVAARQPFPYITPTEYDDDTGRSNYNALQVQLNRRTGGGLLYLLSYTWSKSIDVACSGNYGVEGCELQNPAAPAADRSVSGFDLTHIFTGSLVYELPFGRNHLFSSSNNVVSAVISGWQVNAIATLHSGIPYDVTYQGDLANIGNTFVRANLVGNPSLANPTPAEWINTRAFAIPAPYTFGDLGRNSLRSDWFRNLDFSLFRRFAIRDRLNLEFRAEAFNLTNSAIFAAPGNIINGPNFGVVTSTVNNPRQVQLALKFVF